VERIVKGIYLIRDKKVMMDRDLAELYGVDTAQLKRAVKRNIERFPPDFMFELTLLLQKTPVTKLGKLCPQSFS